MSQYYYNPFGSSDVNEANRQAIMRKERELAEKKDIRKLSFAIGVAILAYIGVQYAVAFALPLLSLRDLYINSSVFQSAFTILGVSFLAVAVPFGVMALCNKSKYAYPIIPNSPIKPLKCFMWVAFGMVCCIVSSVTVSLITNMLEKAFNIKFTQGGELLDPDSILACVMTVIGTAIIPAICEEFAMRCCSLQLLKKYGKGFAVFAVSIVFGLVHGNVVQFIFAFSIGVVMGFATVKTDSIIPAILIHMFNNGISAVNSVVTYATGKDAASRIVLIVYAFWIVSGIISVVCLWIKGEFKKNNMTASQSVLTNGQKFVSFLFPNMILPFLILIIMTATTIKIL